MRVGPKFHPFHWLPHGVIAGPAHPVAQRLRQGDKLGRTGAVEVVETPGHTPGSVTFWCPRSRVAIVGDVMSNAAWLSLPLLQRWSFPPVPRQPMKHLCHSPHQNRRSLEAIMALHPSIIVFGHGPPLVLEEEPAPVPLERTAVG